MQQRKEAKSVEDKLYTPEEVAARYRVHPKTIERWVRVGRLSGLKLGTDRNSKYRFSQSDLDAFEARCRGVEVPT